MYYDSKNENGGFTIVGWYKRGNISDCTILHQKNNNDGSKQRFNDTSSSEEIDYRTITYHLYAIKPTNADFFSRRQSNIL